MGTPVLGGSDPTSAPERGAQPRCRCGAAPPQECCALSPHPLPASPSRRAAQPMVSPHLDEGFGHFSLLSRVTAPGMWAGEEGWAGGRLWTARCSGWHCGKLCFGGAVGWAVTGQHHGHQGQVKGVSCAFCRVLQRHWVKWAEQTCRDPRRGLAEQRLLMPRLHTEPCSTESTHSRHSTATGSEDGFATSSCLCELSSWHPLH